MARLETNRIARVASLIGEPARTAMLVEGGLLAVGPNGQHRYHRLASPEVARLVEGVMQLAVGQSPAARRVAPGPRDERLRTARSCYDHVAGRLGVAIADRLLADGAVELDLAAGTGKLTDRAAASLARLGLRLEDATGTRRTRAVCRPCLDWSERRHHVSGRLGTAILAHCVASGWLRRRPSERALEITRPGAAALRDWLGPARWRAVEQATTS